MITRLQLTNFRRHADTELTFGDGDQLIAICGVNGAGKTTLLEALLFAFYGETRNGRRGLDTLVSRGHELEGVEVACEFTVAGSSFRVQRRRVEGVSSALMFCEGQLLCEGPSAVDAEMVNVLGMDAAGFKLAVIAKQKELDGLTSLSRRERQRMLARLLRVDVVARAQAEAHDRYQRAADVLGAMGSPPDLPALESELEVTVRTVGSLAASVDDTGARLAELDAAITAAGDVDDRHRQALESQAHASGALDQAVAARDSLHLQLADLEPVPEPGEQAREQDEVSDDLRAAEAAAAAAAAIREAAAALASLTQSHSEVVTDIERRRAQLTGVDLDAAGRRADDAREAAEAAEAALVRDRAEVTATETRLRAAEAAADQLADLGATSTCPTCGQQVDAEHLDAERIAAAQAVASLRDELRAAEDRCRTSAGEATEARTTSAEAARALAADEERSRTDERVRAELAELERRRDSYELRLTRDVPEPVDEAPLRARVEALSAELATARQVAADRRRWREHTTRSQSLAAQLAQAEAQVTDLAARLASAGPDEDLVRAHAQLAELRAQREDEAALASSLATELAVARQSHTDAGRRLDEARSFAARRQVQADAARVAAYTKSVLKAVHASLSTELRPSLEGTLTEVLTRLSEGRFTSARLSEHYDVTILDDGAYRPLSELSGGEMDLVALALRLALASVVAERHGTDAMGLLILDEVFGSQDASRREAILAALRELRSLYGQVFVISHVGGIEDAADKVVELHCDTDRRLSEVSVL